MSCPNKVLDVDGEPITDCGDEGRLCGSCREAQAREWEWLRGLSKRQAGIPLTEVELEEERAEMRDAGRL